MLSPFGDPAAAEAEGESYGAVLVAGAAVDEVAEVLGGVRFTGWIAPPDDGWLVALAGPGIVAAGGRGIVEVGALLARSGSPTIAVRVQRDRDGMGRDMEDVTVADKTGALDHLRSDVGIIFSKRGNVAMAITIEDIPQVNWTTDNPGQLMISRLSQVLLEGLTFAPPTQ